MAHVCCGTCQVELLFGNVFQCRTSGAVHVCDTNCDQRLWAGRHCSVCRVSKRVFPPLPAAGSQHGAAGMETEEARCVLRASMSCC